RRDITQREHAHVTCDDERLPVCAEGTSQHLRDAMHPLLRSCLVQVVDCQRDPGACIADLLEVRECHAARLPRARRPDPCLPELEGVVVATRDDRDPRRGEGAGGDGSRMSVEGGAHVAGSGVPHHQGVVGTGRSECATVWTKMYGLKIASTWAEH